MFPMDSFYRIIFCPIIHLLSPLSTYHIYSCLGSRVDLVSNLDPVSSSLLVKLHATSAKCLGDRLINAHRNYDSFCIVSALNLAISNPLIQTPCSSHHQSNHSMHQFLDPNNYKRPTPSPYANRGSPGPAATSTCFFPFVRASAAI
jgi:hypothetical protein